MEQRTVEYCRVIASTVALKIVARCMSVSRTGGAGLRMENAQLNPAIPLMPAPRLSPVLGRQSGPCTFRQCFRQFDSHLSEILATVHVCCEQVNRLVVKDRNLISVPSLMPGGQPIKRNSIRLGQILQRGNALQ